MTGKSLPQLRAALARATKANGPKHPLTLAMRRDYEAAKMTADLAERLTYGGLPFTTSQLDTLETLVREARRKAAQYRTEEAS